jgi:hypothetical protein
MTPALLSTSVLKPFGARGSVSSSLALHCGHGIPAPPQVQARSLSNGLSGWASQTHPQSSQTEHFMGLVTGRAFLSLDQPHHPAPLCPIKRMYDVVPISHVAARSKRRATKRSIAFSVAEARPFHTMEFSQCWARFR